MRVPARARRLPREAQKDSFNGRRAACFGPVEREIRATAQRWARSKEPGCSRQHAKYKRRRISLVPERGAVTSQYASLSSKSTSKRPA